MNYGGNTGFCYVGLRLRAELLENWKVGEEVVRFIFQHCQETLIKARESS